MYPEELIETIFATNSELVVTLTRIRKTMFFILVDEAFSFDNPGSQFLVHKFRDGLAGTLIMEPFLSSGDIQQNK